MCVGYDIHAMFVCHTCMLFKLKNQFILFIIIFQHEKDIVTPSTPHIYVLIIKEIIKKKLNLIQVFKTYLNTSLSRG